LIEISRKGAKRTKNSAVLSFLCVFAPLREHVLSNCASTESIQNPYCNIAANFADFLERLRSFDEVYPDGHPDDVL
jgi:hypothetical protein